MSASMKGGEKLLAKIKELAAMADGGVVKVGFFEGASYPNGMPVATVAAIQEFGAKGVPPRPFFRRMVAQKSPTWGEAAAAGLKATNYDIPRTLGLMGETIASDLQESIIDFSDPPLSPVTVMLRGMRSKGVEITGATVGAAAERVAAGKTSYGASTKPLVDSGLLLRSVAYEVDSNGDTTSFAYSEEAKGFVEK